MRERATSDRGSQAKRIWERQQKEKHASSGSNAASQTKREPISLELAKARTRIAEASALR
jgi:hypothetical protein